MLLRPLINFCIEQGGIAERVINTDDPLDPSDIMAHFRYRNCKILGVGGLSLIEDDDQGHYRCGEGGELLFHNLVSLSGLQVRRQGV